MLFNAVAHLLQQASKAQRAAERQRLILERQRKKAEKASEAEVMLAILGLLCEGDYAVTLWPGCALFGHHCISITASPA